MGKSKLVLALSGEIVILAVVTQNSMSAFGETLLSGSRFMRWALTPFILIFAVFMPLLLEDWNVTRIVLMAGMELACIALLAGFWLPQRWGVWAFRVLGALVFVAYHLSRGRGHRGLCRIGGRDSGEISGSRAALTRQLD